MPDIASDDIGGGPAGGRDGPKPYAASVPNRRPQLRIIDPPASPEETAAIVAAIERFMRETAPPLAAGRAAAQPVAARRTARGNRSRAGRALAVGRPGRLGLSRP